MKKIQEVGPNVLYVPYSENVKTGPMPVTISPRATCPGSCPLKGAGGCYGENYGLNFNWNKTDRGTAKGLVSWEELCGKIKALPKGSLWRHNQAGDLAGEGEQIAKAPLQKLAKANKGRRGFTYTHKRPEEASNGLHIKEALSLGFTVNVSTDSLEGADKAKLAGFPTVVTVPVDYPKVGRTPAGNKVLVCPAQQTNQDTPGIEARELTCLRCGLCQSQDPKRPVIAFRAHGQKARLVSERLKGVQYA